MSRIYFWVLSTYEHGLTIDTTVTFYFVAGQSSGNKDRSNSDPSSFRCVDCPKVFKTKVGYLRHCSKVHGIKFHSCDECCETFTSREEAQRHFRLVTHQRNLLTSTDNSLVKDKLRYVVLNQFGGSYNFKCCYCNETFRTRQGIRTHITKVHIKRNFACNICGKLFLTPKAFAFHKAVQHYCIGPRFDWTNSDT
jgi:uncharacterized C2H2 Zn-finger protein